MKDLSPRRTPKYQPGEMRGARAKVVLFGFYVAFALLAARALTIHIFPPSGGKLQSIANHQYYEAVTLSPYRGAIFDRRKEALAISIRLPSLFVNPRVFRPSDFELQRLARLLRMKPAQITALTKKQTYFAWLRRKAPVSVAEQVMGLEIEGLSQVMEPARYYPAGIAAGQLIGAVGIDDQGVLGIENQFDKDLRGQSLKISPSIDARGRPIFFQSDRATPEKSGNNIYLAIDRVIQEITEEALVVGIKKARAKSGFVIVSDPHTGRVLATANYPQFNPNDREDLEPVRTRNKAFLDIFEPGSVLKPFVIAAALEKKKTHEEELHDCEKGYYRSGSVRIRDDHPKEILTTAETLVHSSNICTFKIALRLGKQALYESLKGFGFGGALLPTHFPGEMMGRISAWEHWRPSRFANVAFGQGLAVTGLELVQAYGAIANGGKLMAPYFIDKIESSEGLVVSSYSAEMIRRVLSPEIARSMRGILAKVVTDGTGGNAATASYTSGGKTGTAEKVDPQTKRYGPDKRIASFAGFAPVQDPHLVIYVMIDEPQEKPYYGGTWAAPVFSEIAEKSLKYLNVAPDKPDTAPLTVAKHIRHIGTNEGSAQD